MARTVAETARLRLREWDDEDERLFYGVMNTQRTMRFLGGVQTPEQWHSAYLRIRGFQADYGHTFWIVEDKKARDILGFCGIKRTNAPGAGELTGVHEIGWRLREDVWGQGIAKEAAIASLDLAFRRFSASEVITMTVPANLSSQGLMERLGMTRRADLDFRDARYGDDLNPSIIWRITSADWRAARERALRPL